MRWSVAKWYYNRWTVLIALFMVAGPLGLPLLWRSSQFSERAKWSLTALTVLTTGLLVVFASVAFQQLLTQMQEFTASLR